MSTVPGEIGRLAGQARRVTVLTGAGMSAESGIPTFRDAQSGLWARFRPEDLATPEAWHRDPARVWAWYAWRTRLARRCTPHSGHLALARWAERDGVHLRVVTQNVDDLHERAGSAEVAHLHGSLFAYRCDTCDEPYRPLPKLPARPVERLPPPGCPVCGVGQIRPDIVWFGEPLDDSVFGSAIEAIADADLLLVVGTSGMVFPAAGLPAVARGSGVPVIELNPHPGDLCDQVDFSWRVSAARGLPSLVEALGQ